MANTLKTVTDETFEAEVLKKPGFHFVEFGAEWCAPCKAVMPYLEALSQTYTGKVAFSVVDTEESPTVAENFRIRSLPTMLIIKDGRVVDQLVGAMSKQQLDARITRALGN